MKPCVVIFRLAFTFYLLTSQVFANESAAAQITEQDFQNALAESLGRMREVLHRKTYRVQDVNHSLQKTIDAVSALVDQNDLTKAETLLKEALRLLPNNAMAGLILADVYEKQGELDKANEQYRHFLEKAALMSSLTQDIMSWKTRLALSGYVRNRLRAQGIHIEEPKSLPLMARLETDKNSTLLQAISFSLPITIVFSMFFLIFGYVITDGDITKASYYRIGSRFFFVTVLTYLLWLAHLFLQTRPLFHSEEFEVIAIMLLGAIGIFLLEIHRAIQKRKEKLLDPSTVPCRRCKRFIEKLASFCPYCKENY